MGCGRRQRADGAAPRCGLYGSAVLSALLGALHSGAGGQAVDAALSASYTHPNALLHPLLAKANEGTRSAYRLGSTPLHIAVFFGDAEAVQLLLAAGAAPNAVDASGATPMHYCTCSLLPAFQSDEGAHHALPHPDIPRMLLEAGGNIFSATRGAQGQPIEAPLLFRTHISSAAAASAFLQHAAEQHTAGRWQPPSSYRLHPLVERAASVQCAPFYQLFRRHSRTHKDAKLVQAITMGLTAVVREMLQEGASVAALSSWLLGLVVAAPDRDPALVRLLLHHGMPVTSQALGQAVAGGMPQPELLKLLLERGHLWWSASHWVTIQGCRGRAQSCGCSQRARTGSGG